jgi:hypothetical protein
VQAIADTSNMISVNFPCIAIGALVVVLVLFVLPTMFRDGASLIDDWKQTYPITNPRSNEPEISKETGSIIAYRYFDYVDGEYWSMSSGIVGQNPITNRPRGNYQGGWNISDRVPTLNNKSGIYAAKKKNSPILRDYAAAGTLAKVELSGRVIEGEYGYRAQYCRILEVYE